MARTGRTQTATLTSQPPLEERILRKAAALQEAGRLRDAVQQLERVLQRNAVHAEANYKLGIIKVQAGFANDAIPHLTTALKGNPAEPRYWLSLTTALLGLGRVADARAILERFTRESFSDPLTLATKTALVGNLYQQAQGLFGERKFKEAEELVDIIVLLDENNSEAIHFAGLIAASTDRPELAYDLMSISIYQDGNAGRFFVNLSNIFSNRREFLPAIECLEKAIELGEDNFLAHNNLGLVLHKAHRFEDAIRHLETSIALNAECALAHNNLGTVYHDMGRIEQAIAAFDQALAIDPTLVCSHSNRLFSRLYANAYDPAEFIADARAFGTTFADPLLRRRPFTNDREPGRRLRVGFVSGDFFEHAVNHFFEPALRNFDKTRLELFAYSNTPGEDKATARLKTHFDVWRSIRCLDDDQTADLIEADGIDILVDMSGHTAGNRLLVFARKPAPIQVTWLGFVASTGVSAIDYRFTEGFSEPEGIGDDLYVETLWRLPRVSACYQATPTMPAVAPRAPFLENGHLTFGCFNRFTKVSDRTLQAWAEIQRRIPDARLLLEVASVDSDAIRAQVEQRLSDNGLPLDRVTLEPRLPRNRFVLNNRVDAALDPFPYNGGTTSLDTLYMGVPFIALEGDTFSSRMGHSILNNVGLPELSVPTVEAYIDLAVRMAEDRDWLLDLRDDLRGRMMRSPHMDHQLLSADLADAFEAMWRRWVAEQAD
ncbi:tetratricopeptide repeat protein [Methylobacterium dankookense]|uniref:protein O-GlcNAc transferase n=1 Tax=Methylobacterium dankookense TaxID=560405 RepID=A0A564FXA6_9HYPH|nr:tetratricopeptide repeat protein [Methylobacterium dankookense]GJD54427.1 Beta-barrel assembly-enhancing protease [Methylobacterium dankookense]VUF12773.1 UDP-glucose:protein N-beta-glucosyltransferase [Methylobacterium dankookense]